MSLLLDALKKAAEDKKKASSAETVPITGVDKTDAAPEAVTTTDLTLEEVINSDNTSDSNVNDNVVVSDIVDVEKSDSSEELTLDVEPVPAPAISTNHSASPGVNLNEERPSISDDALSLLIYKTNSAVKKRKRFIAFGTTIASLLVLGLGGVYYYFNLQEEINSLELKHRTAMMRMESKTNKQRPPEKKEILSNLTANNDIEIEVKEEIVVLKKEIKIPQQNNQSKSDERNRLARDRARSLQIEKLKQADIIDNKLNTAWSAYESANYVKAKNFYQEVILVEKNNRDALLGLGAIAVIEKDTVTAKEIYAGLLKQDPNDPLAIAALTNLRGEDTSPNLSEKFLVSMLEKTPDVAQLNFELGNVYAQQSKWSAAQQSYFKAWQQENNNADYLFNLAVSLDQLGQVQQAINFYKDSLIKAKNKKVSFIREIVEKRISELSGL